MRVSVLQENLAKGLSIVTRAVASRPSMPILSNVLLSTEESRLNLSATNLELSISARIGANVEEEGAITVPAKTILELINTMPPERVDLELDARTQTLTVRCGGYVNKIKGLDAAQFPAVAEAEADTGVALPAQTFQNMINQVHFAAAKEDNRPILMGILTKFNDGVLSLIAADGFRLAVRSAELEEASGKSMSLIIPAKTLGEVARIIGSDDKTVYVSIPPGRGQVMFDMGDVNVVSQLIDGKFPDVEHLIPKTCATSTIIYKNDLMRASKHAEIFAREANNTTRLCIKPGESNLVPGYVLITAQGGEKGDNEGMINASIDGPGLEISFNVRYMLDVLAVITEDQVVLETNGAAQPGVIKPVGRQDFVYLIMPMSTR